MLGIWFSSPNILNLVSHYKYTNTGEHSTLWKGTITIEKLKKQN